MSWVYVNIVRPPPKKNRFGGVPLDFPWSPTQKGYPQQNTPSCENRGPYRGLNGLQCRKSQRLVACQVKVLRQQVPQEEEPEEEAESRIAQMFIG